MSIVKPHGPTNFISNRMGIPAYDNIALDYVAEVLQSLTYSLDGDIVARVSYTYDAQGDMINAQRVI